MNFEPSSRQLSFVLPSTFARAEVVFSSKSGVSEDIHIPINPTPAPRQVLSLAKLKSGRWQIRLNWSEGHQQYFDEKDIIIW